MMTVLFVAFAITLAAIIAAFLMASDRKDKRHARQVADLCQRLQAPEQAVIEHAAMDRSPSPVLNFDDDDAWHDNRERVSG